MMPDLVVHELHHRPGAPVRGRGDNTLFVGWRATGTHTGALPNLAPTGRVMHTDGITFVTLCEPDEQSLYELSACQFWRVFDWQDLFAQAGSFPAPQLRFDAAVTDG
jgi:hypothetical protein